MERKESLPVNVHLRGADSAGQLAVIELAVAPDNYGPPLHVHPLHGEGFYVLDGEVTFQVRDEIMTAGTGTFLFAAPGVSHTFANRTAREARLLVLCAPAGFETYFEQMASDYTDGRWPSPARPDPADAIAVGPPIGPQTSPSDFTSAAYSDGGVKVRDAAFAAHQSPDQQVGDIREFFRRLS